MPYTKREYERMGVCLEKLFRSRFEKSFGFFTIGDSVTKPYGLIKNNTAGYSVQSHHNNLVELMEAAVGYSKELGIG